MARVRLTRQASSDLEAIIEYYEGVGANEFAEVVEESLIERMRSLERSPRRGRVVPEIDDESIREVLYRSYRIVYVLDRDDDVEVLTIFHSSQQFGASDAS